MFSEQDEHIHKNTDIIPSEKNRYVSNDNIFEYQSKIIFDVSNRSDCIIVGRCANHLLQNSKHRVLRIFIYAPDDVCIETIMKKFSVSRREAEKTFRQINKHRKEYFRYHTGREWDSAENYDMCFDTSKYTYEQVVSLIKNYAEIFSKV